MTRATSRTSILLAVGGVLAAVAVGVLVATTLDGGGLIGGDGRDGANGSVPVEDLADLDGSWRVVNSVGAPQPVVGEVRLRFTEGRVLVETGCNTGRGTVELVDGRLVAGPLMSTKLGCEPALMEQESWLFAMVSSHPRLERSGPYLHLSWDTPDALAPEGAAPPGGASSSGERWWLGLEQETDAPTS